MYLDFSLVSTHRSYSDNIELVVSQVFFLNLIMERKTLWFGNIVVDIKGEAGILASYSELSGEDVEENNFIFKIGRASCRERV